MENGMKVKRFMGVVILVVLLGVLIFIVNLSAGQIDNAWVIVSAMIVVSIGVVAIISIRKSMKDLKSGYPMDDEMSKAIKMRAGYLAFFISLYFLFAMSFVHSIFDDSMVAQMPTSEWLMIYVAAMGTIFLATHTYYKRKGVPE